MKQTLCLFLFSLLASAVIAQVNINWTDPIDVAPSSFGNDYPRIVLNGDNIPLITWGGNNKVYFSKMAMTGFTDPLKLNNDTTNAYVASWTGPDLAARNDTIYASFMHQEWGEKTYLIRSFDNGDSFSEPVLIENYPDSTSRFPTVTIDQAGHPLVGIMKMAHNESNPHYVIRKSLDHGVSFTEESNAGGWSGAESIACDCCPASLKASDENVVLIYRDNLNNIRDIYASVSSDYGATFPQGFAVDNNEWQIFGCPSSGPDAVIIGDTLYSVFLSKNRCYLSRSSISDGTLISIDTLGASNTSGTQNYPRIDNYNNQVAISWRENSSGTKLFLSYTDDITNGLPFLQDTVFTSSLSSGDLVLGEDGIHIALEDINNGTVKYMKGTFGTTPVRTIENYSISLYPNPTSDYITIKGYEQFDKLNLYTLDGKLISSGTAVELINVSMLESGSYILELIDADKKSIKSVFVKN